LTYAQGLTAFSTKSGDFPRKFDPSLHHIKNHLAKKFGGAGLGDGGLCSTRVAGGGDEKGRPNWPPEVEN
jgi:hypothetical protein